VHEEVDNLILQAIKNGEVQFTPIMVSVRKHFKHIEWRTVDKRLQSLRRRNLIEYGGTPRSWRVRDA